MKQYFLSVALPAVLIVALAGCGGGNGSSRGGTAPAFRSLSNFKVSGDVAEIITGSPDEKTLVYTDSSRREIGFIDAADPAGLKQLGVLAMGGEPTSVAFSKDGKFALAVVAGTNELNIIDALTRTSVRRVPLGGQPDSIAISPDGKFAAIAIENERSNADAPMPQLPAGFVVVVNLTGEPAAWTTKKVNLAGLAGLRFPSDPEPEFIDINSSNRAAVTLQENNAIVIINLASGTVERSFSAGTVTHAADTKDDGKVEFTDEIRDARREPDAIQWTRGGNLLIANEGDYDLDLVDGQFTGGRGFSILSPTGQVLFDVADGLEREAAKAGVYPDGRSDNKGTEPEGAKIVRIGNREFAFIALERARALAVYDLTSETAPRFVQILKTGDSPEGVSALPGRGLVVSANEGDGTVSVFGL